MSKNIYNEEFIFYLVKGCQQTNLNERIEKVTDRKVGIICGVFDF